MRLKYNPKDLGNRKQAWKCFLIGSLVASSLIYLVITEDPVVTIAALAMAFAGAVLFIFTNINFVEPVFLFQNIVSAILGVAVSLAFYVSTFLPVYLVIIMILVVVTWGQKFTLRGKDKTKKKAKN